MSYSATVYKVMVSAPGDVYHERRVVQEILAAWNSAHSEERNIILMPIGWESRSMPDMGGMPIRVSDNQLLKSCDCFVGVYWTRLGIPFRDYISLSVGQINEHMSKGKPTLLYFSNAPIPEKLFSEEQFNELTEFRDMSPWGKTYETIEDFKEIFSRDIQDLFSNSKLSGGESNTDENKVDEILSKLLALTDNLTKEQQDNVSA